MLQGKERNFRVKLFQTLLEVYLKPEGCVNLRRSNFVLITPNQKDTSVATIFVSETSFPLIQPWMHDCVIHFAAWTLMLFKRSFGWNWSCALQLFFVVTILTMLLHNSVGSFAAVFRDVTQRFRGSVAWHPERRLRRKLPTMRYISQLPIRICLPR